MISLVDGSLYQWDISRAVIVENKTVDEIHFAHYGDKEALVVKATKCEDGSYTANIPNILLTSSKSINVYVVYNEKTIESCKLKVVEREKPADYVYTEEEVKQNQFEKVYEGIIQDVTFDKPYTELYFIYTTMMGYGADVSISLDDGSDIFGWVDGAEKTKYYAKLDGIGAIFDVNYDYYPIYEFEIFPNANYMTKFLISVDGEVDNTTDTLTIYAR